MTVPLVIFGSYNIETTRWTFLSNSISMLILNSCGSSGSFVLQVSTGLEAFVQSTLSINAASDGPTAVARLDSTYEGRYKSLARSNLLIKRSDVGILLHVHCFLLQRKNCSIWSSEESTDSSPYHLYCLDIPKNWNEETTREESISILDQKTGFKKSRLDVLLCLRQVYLGCAQGLDVQTAKVRLVEFGPNVLSHKSRATWWWILWNAFFHPFNMILLVLAAISGATSDMSTLSIMVAMVVLSVGLRFWQVCFL